MLKKSWRNQTADAKDLKEFFQRLTDSLSEVGSIKSISTLSTEKDFKQSPKKEIQRQVHLGIYVDD